MNLDKAKQLMDNLPALQQDAMRSWQGFLRSRWFLVVWFGVVVVAISAILTIPFGHIPEQLNVGDIAPHDIKADRRYEIRDEEASERMSREIESTLRPVYDYNLRVVADSEQKLAKVFEGGRDIFNRRLFVEEQNTQVSKLIQEEIGVALQLGEIEGLRRMRFARYYETLMKRMLGQVLVTPIVGDKEDLTSFKEKGILIRTVGVDKEEQRLEEKIDQIGNVAKARAHIVKLGEANFFDRVPGLKPAAMKMLNELVAPNLNYNASETESQRDRALKSMKEIVIKIEPGEAIVRSGDRLESWHITVLKGIQKQRGQVNIPMKFLAVSLLLCLCLLVPLTFARRYVKKFSHYPADLVFLGFILMLVVSIREFFGAASSVLYDVLAPYGLTLEAFYSLMPIAFGAMLVRLVLNSETAIIFSIVSTLVMGIHFDASPTILLHFLLVQIAGAAAVAYADRRSALLKAGLWTGLIAATIVITTNLIQAAAFLKAIDFTQWLWQAALSMVGGVLASSVVLMLTPLVELVFDYTTDIKLLELGNLNHPLLRDLLVKAPGTYHHSHITGVLAESAAQAIGANPLFARVASYFHDIGKMVKAEYFIENQPAHEDRHGPLTPHMSALIISSHVREGLVLAKKHNLPQRVADIIPQHQGTKLMGYFYHKAKTQQVGDEAEVNEWDFRYDGPKPQTREAGIILLADGAEAATRALKEKTPLQIREVVRSMINKNFIDGQLDECELTLKDLHSIAESFVRILNGIYHKRIPYPETGGATGYDPESAPIPQGGNQEAQGLGGSGGQLLRIPRD